MKVTVTKETPKFQPVTVTLTLTSVKEIQLLNKIVGRNYSSAVALAQDKIITNSEVTEVSEMFSEIFDKLDVIAGECT